MDDKFEKLQQQLHKIKEETKQLEKKIIFQENPVTQTRDVLSKYLYLQSEPFYNDFGVALILTINLV